MNVKQLDCLLAEHERKRGKLWLRIRAVVRRFLDLKWEGEGMTKEEQEKCELLGIIQGKDKAIADLKKENDDLQRRGDIWRDKYIDLLQRIYE